MAFSSFEATKVSAIVIKPETFVAFLLVGVEVSVERGVSAQKGSEE